MANNRLNLTGDSQGGSPSIFELRILRGIISPIIVINARTKAGVYSTDELEGKKSMIEKEQAKTKAEQIKGILAPLLKQKLNQRPQVEERSDGGNRKYYKVTWSMIGRRTFAAVNMKGHLTIHKAPTETRITYEHHFEELEKNGFKIEHESHGRVNNRYVKWDIPNLEEFVKLQFEYYTQDMQLTS